MSCCCSAILLNIPLFIGFVTMFGLVGLIMYVYFKDCDPLLAGVITKKDQVGCCAPPQVFTYLKGNEVTSLIAVVKLYRYKHRSVRIRVCGKIMHGHELHILLKTDGPVHHINVLPYNFSMDHNPE